MHGSVTLHMVTDANVDPAGKATTPKEPIRYQVAPSRDDVCAVSYTSKGYTLTTILDFESMKLVAFSSDQKMVSIQHGTFETPDVRASEAKAAETGAHPH